ncbi:hypothetical protein [Chitinophaga rhizosphaerae]|uniref:hypothetical protein n=1 Tax=Chitinophaga rhizosphaerae TaxID=1864947 RepID=UPI000F80098A|nr:hypothetical protein [Chitinophaga rhizosphaerae]
MRKICCKSAQWPCSNPVIPTCHEHIIILPATDAFDVLETELKMLLVNMDSKGRIWVWRYDPAAGEMELQTLTPSLWKQ